jgi:V/A-type H+-transporting ATPase subunit A
VQWAHSFLQRGKTINEMMQVVGEEGTSIDDFIIYLKSEFLDNVYLQQNAFDEVDAACPTERQKYLFGMVSDVLSHDFDFDSKSQARDMFFTLTEQFRDWNYSPWESDKMKEHEEKIRATLSQKEAADA